MKKESIDESIGHAARGANKMSDEQRQKIAEVLDTELEEELQKLEHSGSKYMDGWSEENWEREMESHPFFSNQGSLDGSKELSPLMKGLQDLKYSADENTPPELAANYKEDGNFNFKCKKYRMAVLSYTEGLRNANLAMSNMDEMDDQERSNINTLKAQLITNRAASQFRLGNYRSSLLDCRMALKELPSHMKAVERAVECCIKLNRHKECMEWCDKGLVLISSEVSQDTEKKKHFQNWRAQAEKRYKEAERNRRKEEAAIRMAKKEEQTLLAAIQSRGIEIRKTDTSEQGEEDSTMMNISDIEPCHPAALKKSVHLVESNDGKSVLVWPVLFLYPEHGETDFIEEFTESDTVDDHLCLMFNQSEPPPWDIEGKYRSAESINVYFEDASCAARPKLVMVDTRLSLLEVLSKRNGYPGVNAGTPTFIVLAKRSPFEKEFLKKYN